VVDEHQLAGHLVAGDVLAGLGDDLVERHQAPVAGLDDRDDPLSPPLVGDTDDDRVEHVGMGLQRAFDLFGVDLLASRVDRHRPSTEDRDGAVGLPAGVVTGYRPADPVHDGERRRRLDRVVVVAERDATGAGQLPHHPDRGRLEVVGEDRGLVVDREPRHR